MPEYKKQHYVPQLILRYFSTDREKKCTNVFNPDKEFYKRDCPLKDQAQENYFYGENGEIEKSLSNIESKVAPILLSIVRDIKAPSIDTEDYGDLLIFTLLLGGRTRFVAERSNEVLNKLFQELAIVGDKPSVKEKNIRIKHKRPAVEILRATVKALKGADDLKMKLVVNKTKIKFITSDNPVVKYNQYLEMRNHPGGHTGLLNKGLQIFFPLSPDLMIHYYDDWAYKVGDRKKLFVSVEDESDISQLNFLQIVNCYKSTFSTNSTNEHYLLQLSQKAKKLRKLEYHNLTEVERSTDHEQTERIVFAQHNVERKIKLSLSFIKQPKIAKRHVLSNHVVQVRDESKRNGKYLY